MLKLILATLSVAASLIAALIAGNTQVVGVASNVAYGPAEIMKSLAVLDAAGIRHTGAGANLDAAHAPEARRLRSHFLIRVYSSSFVAKRLRSRAPDQHARQEHQHSAGYHLKRRAHKRSIHIPVPNVTDPR